VDRDAAADQAAHRVAPAQQLEREGEDGLDLGRVGLEVELAGVGDAADEGVDAVAGDEGRRRRQLLTELDRSRIEADLLVGLAQRRGGQVGVGFVFAPAGERDLTGVTAKVGAPLGEDEARLLRPAVERQQDRGVDFVPQMITWTVPPSTDQAAPLT
jgi:hypothetical protein